MRWPKRCACWPPAARCTRSRTGAGGRPSSRSRGTRTSGRTTCTTQAAMRWPTTRWSGRPASSSGLPSRATRGATSTPRAPSPWSPPADGSSTWPTRPPLPPSGNLRGGISSPVMPTTESCSGSGPSVRGFLTFAAGPSSPLSFSGSWWPSAAASMSPSVITRRSVPWMRPRERRSRSTTARPAPRKSCGTRGPSSSSSEASPTSGSPNLRSGHDLPGRRSPHCTRERPRSR